MAILSIWQLTFACASKNLVFVQQQLPKQWEKCGQFWPKTDVCLRLCNYKRNAGNFGQKHVARLHSKRLGLAGCLQRVTRWAFWFVYFHFCICVFQLVYLYLCICIYASNFTEKYVLETWPCWLPAESDQMDILMCVFAFLYLYFNLCICVIVCVHFISPRNTCQRLGLAGRLQRVTRSEHSSGSGTLTTTAQVLTHCTTAQVLSSSNFSTEYDLATKRPFSRISPKCLLPVEGFNAFFMWYVGSLDE